MALFLCLLALPALADPFEDWLDDSAPIADGLSPPVERGWRAVGALPGTSAWRARGDAPAPVATIAAGRVAAVDETSVAIEHVWYEDHRRVEARSVYEGLTAIDVAPGDAVERGQAIGAARGLQLAIDGADGAPVDLIADRAALFVPQDEPVLALVHHDRYEMRIYRDGALAGRYAVSFGQAKGAKTQRGDNMSPKGMYFVVVRSTGPFTGPVGAYYGGYWIKINYPNAYDAQRGLDAGWITREQASGIERDWSRRALTNQQTKLGSGIGFHGWASEWSNDGPRHLSWGCIVMHLYDAPAVYAHLQDGAMVVLF